jgi:predicted permease
MVDVLRQDVWHAVRALRRAPAFSVTVIVTIALAIGGNTAVFSLLDAVLLRPLPVPHPEELFALREASPRLGDEADPTSPAAQFSYPQFERFDDALGGSGGLAAVSTVARMNVRLSSGSDTERLSTQLVSPGFFRLAGVGPQLGRLLAAVDRSRIDAQPEAVISDALWRRDFAASPDVVGRHIVVNNAPVTVVGVTAGGFTGIWVESPVDVWLPIVMQHAVGYNQNYSANDADANVSFVPQEGLLWLTLLARTPPSASAGIRARLSGAYRTGLPIRAERFEQGPRRDAFLARQLQFDSVSRGMSRVRPQYASPLYLLMALVALVLAIACLNIANVMLARAAARRYDVATRLSLGAPAWRLVRQPIIETVLLAMVGGGLGLAVGHYASRAIAMMAIDVPFPFSMRVLGFSAAATLLSAIVFGLVPALSTIRHASQPAAVHGAGGDRSRTAVRPMQPLVALQVAMAFVLTAAAVMFASTLRHVTAIDPGFEREQLAVLWLRPPISGYTKEQWPALHDRVLAAARRVPGVTSATLSVCGLASGCRNSETVALEGITPPDAERPRLLYNFVAAGYFDTVGMRVLRGRGFDTRDRSSSPSVAVINETAARQYFSGFDPLGRRFGYGSPQFEIIGVVSDARTADITSAPVPMVFYPLTQSERPANSLEARVAGDPAQAGAALRRAIAAAEPRLVIERVTTIGDQLRRNADRQRLIALLSAGFGGIALVLTCVGLYGVLSYMVAQRTREMAVRLAVGATGRDIIRLVLTRAGWLLTIGVLAGLLGTLAVVKTAVDGLLVGTSASDPGVLAAVATALVALGLAAAFVPAWRAAAVDPITSLRAE